MAEECEHKGDEHDELDKHDERGERGEKVEGAENAEGAKDESKQDKVGAANASQATGAVGPNQTASATQATSSAKAGSSTQAAATASSREPAGPAMPGWILQALRHQDAASAEELAFIAWSDGTVHAVSDGSPATKAATVARGTVSAAPAGHAGRTAPAGRTGRRSLAHAGLGGALKTLARRLRGAGRHGIRVQTLPRPDAKGTYAPSARRARIAWLDPLPTQKDGTSFGALTRGLPMPADGLAYVVERAGEGRVRVIGYVDRFLRAFSASGPILMAPDRPCQLRLHIDEDGGGFVGLADGRGGAWDVAELTCAPDGTVEFTGSRVNLGLNRRPLAASTAAALAYVAFCELPRVQGVKLRMLDAGGALSSFEGHNLFADVGAFLQAMDEASHDPLLRPPGILLYLAHLLRATGIVDETPASMAALVASSMLPVDFNWISVDGGALLEVTLGTADDGPADGSADNAADDAADGSADNAAGPAGQELPDKSDGHVTHLRPLTGPSPLVLTLGDDDKPPQPEIGLMRTSDYADTFYVSFRREQVNHRAVHILLETEGVLNRFLFMVRALGAAGMLNTASQAQCAELDRVVVENVLSQVRDEAGHVAQGSLPSGASQPAGQGAGEGASRSQGASEAQGAGAGQGRTAGQPTSLPKDQPKNQPKDQPDTDLDIRIAFAAACERLALPYRLEYRFRLDATSEHLFVDATAPDMSFMPRDICTDENHDWRTLPDADLFAASARYAAHLAILLGVVGFGASERVRVVSVNVWRDQREDDAPAAMRAFEQTCELSVSFARERFADLLAARPDGTPGLAAASREPFAFIGSFTHAFTLEASGSLSGTRPLTSLDSVVQAHERIAALPVSPWDAVPATRSGSLSATNGPLPGPLQMLLTLSHGLTNGIETDAHAFDPAGRRLLAARNVRDMGIYEDTSRKALASEAEGALRNEGTHSALSCLRDIYDRSESPLVRQACLSASDGIVRDTITAETPEKMSRIFSDVYGLQADMRAVPRDPRQAVPALEAVVRKVEEAGWFSDTQTRAYRYFDCYASRAIYGARCADDLAGRDLGLAADEYFLAHHRLAAILSTSVERGEDAIAHARRCVELAPSVASAYLRLARCYFSVFDYRSEIEVLKQMLRIAWNPNDISMALYWLGYAYWMCDMPEVGTACYQRSVSYDQNIMQTVTAELASFVGKSPADLVGALVPDDEVDKVLAEAGVSLALTTENANLLVECADASLRAGSRPLALNLLGCALALLRDDALTPVLESLGTDA